MIQAIINDFQSIKEAKLKIEGMTLIIGESSQGKSACLRALQAACTNRFKAGQVRHGEDHALVRIKVPESNEVLSVLRPWAGGSPKMKLGNQEFSKLGRTLPSQVTDFLNLGFLDVSGESYSCNFHSQFQPPLLLAYSQPKVMELLSASTALDDLKETKEALMEARANNKGAITAVESIITNTNRDIKPVEDAINVLEPLVSELTAVSDNLSGVESMEAAYKLLQESEAALRMLEVKQQILEELVELEVNMDLIDQLQLLAQDLDTLFAEACKVDAKESLLQDLVDTYDPDFESKLSSIAMLSELCKTYEVCTASEDKISSRVSVINEMIEADNYLQGVSRVRYAAFSELLTFKSQYDLLEGREQGLLEVVENHICPVCGSRVSYNEEN